MTRKEFLKLTAAGALSFLHCETVLASARGSRVRWGRLKFPTAGHSPENWSVHPNGDLNLMDQILEHTTVRLDFQWNVADVQKIEQMSRYPFLFMHAEAPPVLDESARANLREYFLRGGFLFAEDCVIGSGSQGNNGLNDKFFLRMAEELPRILPEAQFERLPTDHPIFAAFYPMREWPHMQGTPHGPWGLTLHRRLVALLSPSDLHCGWTAGARWFGPSKAEAALRMGTNIYVHAMTQDL